MDVKYNGWNETKLGKFKVRWLGPYKICEVAANGAIKLSTLADQPIKETVNGSKLKIYHHKQQRNDPVRPKAGPSRTN